MRRVRIAIAGFGMLGRTIAEMILNRQSRFRTEYGVEVIIVAVWRSSSGLYCDTGLEQQDFSSEMHKDECGAKLLYKCNPDVLIEAGPSDFKTGGSSLEYLRNALRRGCHVICVSKGALVYDGQGLCQLASQSGSLMKLSGAAGAALPCIDLLKYSTLGCRILEIKGSLNATSNYILNLMMAKGISFEEALQSITSGSSEVAEKDPSLDFQGWDTACKLILIAQFGLRISLKMSNLTVTGIESITASQVREWKEHHLHPRLVGTLSRSKDDDEIWTASVKVETFPADHPFALVTCTKKGVLVSTDLMGDIFASAGGPEPNATAASAVKDLESILRGETK